MSQENVELARKALEASDETYRTGDMLPWTDDTLRQAFDPEVILRPPRAEY